jgi:hypothetical protein
LHLSNLKAILRIVDFVDVYVITDADGANMTVADNKSPGNLKFGNHDVAQRDLNWAAG